MQTVQQNSAQKKIIASSIFALILIALFVSISSYEMKSNITAAAKTSNQVVNAASQAGSSSATQISPTSTSTARGNYKDGTYSATTNYYVPHGNESIAVRLTIKDGTVVSSEINNSENNSESARYQQDFASEYQSHVIGKNISSVDLSYVAGASDTTQGFNDALQSIISQAKA